jgi:hypothetical protein
VVQLVWVFDHSTLSVLLILHIWEGQAPYLVVKAYIGLDLVSDFLQDDEVLIDRCRIASLVVNYGDRLYCLRTACGRRLLLPALHDFTLPSALASRPACNMAMVFFWYISRRKNIICMIGRRYTELPPTLQMATHRGLTLVFADQI